MSTVLVLTGTACGSHYCTFLFAILRVNTRECAPVFCDLIRYDIHHVMWVISRLHHFIRAAADKRQRKKCFQFRIIPGIIWCSLISHKVCNRYINTTSWKPWCCYSLSRRFFSLFLLLGSVRVGSVLLVCAYHLCVCPYYTGGSHDTCIVGSVDCLLLLLAPTARKEVYSSILRIYRHRALNFF